MYVPEVVLRNLLAKKKNMCMLGFFLEYGFMVMICINQNSVEFFPASDICEISSTNACHDISQIIFNSPNPFWIIF